MSIYKLNVNSYIPILRVSNKSGPMGTIRRHQEYCYLDQKKKKKNTK